MPMRTPPTEQVGMGPHLGSASVPRGMLLCQGKQVVPRRVAQQGCRQWGGGSHAPACTNS
eukprot:scaffold23998_cov20-Tisochrysis_lutea.AAC.2